MSRFVRRVTNRVFYVWRILGTGFSFGVFYLCGVLVSWLVVPIIPLLFRDPDLRQQRMRTFQSGWFRAFVGLMKTVGVVRDVHVRNRHAADVDGPCLLVANHPTLIDVVAVVSEYPDVSCVVKPELWNSLMVGPVIRACGNIPDRSALDLYESCLDTVEDGESILFFPEGTRSPTGELRPFSRVAAQVASTTGTPIVPVVIHCNVPTLKKNQPWYEVPPEPLAMTLEFHDPFTVEAGTTRSSKSVSERVTEELRDFFRRELGYA